jgi:ketosteroid isomerase-like protein
VSQESIEVVLRGYRAFVSGDLETINALLAPEIEWVGVEEEPATPARRDAIIEILRERFAEGYRIELERCLGIGDQVVISARFAHTGGDPADDRPLQTRRYYTVGRYAGIVTIDDGRVVRVQDCAHLAAALEAVGVEEDAH